MQTRRVALIVFYDEQKRILLQHWWPNPSPYGEEWRFFGGEINAGETPEQAVVRETREELDYELKDYSLVADFEAKAGNISIHRHVFISPLEGKMQKFTQLEGDRMQLFSLGEAAKQKLVPGDEIVIQKLKEVLK